MRLGGKTVSALILGIVIAQGAPAASVTVLVYNYANVSASRLADAESFASRSYHAAGIEVTWVECGTSEDAERFRACERAMNGGGRFLRILPEDMAAGIQRVDKTKNLGIALGAHAYVFYPSIETTARSWGVPEYLVLGRTMAHELGHLLLGDNSHSAAGLMMRRFGWRALKNDSGQALFDSKQAARLRQLLQTRRL